MENTQTLNQLRTSSQEAARASYGWMPSCLNLYHFYHDLWIVLSVGILRSLLKFASETTVLISIAHWEMKAMQKSLAYVVHCYEIQGFSLTLDVSIFLKQGSGPTPFLVRHRQKTNPI